MLVLKCDSCGFEQVIKRERAIKERKEMLKDAIALYCDRNNCQGKHTDIPVGYIKHSYIHYGWEVVK